MLSLLLRVAGGFVARNKTATTIAAGYSFGMFQDGSPKIDPKRKLITNSGQVNRKAITDSKPIFDTSVHGVTKEIPQHVILRNKSLQKMVDSEWCYLTRNSSILRGLVK